MGFVAQWRTIARALPEGWGECRLRVTPARKQDSDRMARLLGPASPGRAGSDLLLQVLREQARGTERLLGRLDEAGVPGTVELVGEGDAQGSRPTERKAAVGLSDTWDDLVAELPADWSDLLCLVELRSSDDLGRAALALAPVNPSRHGRALAYRFRVARRFGYGAAPEMARRSLARLDEQGIPGDVSLLEAFADTGPVLTQGPTFQIWSRAV